MSERKKLSAWLMQKAGQNASEEDRKNVEELLDILADYDEQAVVYQKMYKKYEDPVKARLDKRRNIYQCPDCGTRILLFHRYCGGCGKRVEI